MTAQKPIVDQPATASDNFDSQGRTAEDLLSQKTIGLVSLGDYRKRRAEVAELKEREARDASNPIAAARLSDAARLDAPDRSKNKKRKKASRPKLSFDPDLSNDESSDALAGETPASKADVDLATGNIDAITKSPAGPNKKVAAPPRLMTKSALAREAAMKEQLRQEYMKRQEVVRESRIAVPFKFYDGRELEGGCCTVKKSHAVWYFLDLARNLGLGLAASTGDNSRRDWHRISVDDLMLVKNGIILPQHYEFYYFILHQSKGYDGKQLLDFSREPLDDQEAGSTEQADQSMKPLWVVDRRWFEKNKHIFPVSTWEAFDPDKDYAATIKRDPNGNRYFFS